MSENRRNADPEVVRFFAALLRRFFEVPDERLRVACHLYADHIERQQAIEQVNAYSRASKRKRVNMLTYGTCKLTISSTQIVQHIYGAIQEYCGFDRPEWLD